MKAPDDLEQWAADYRRVRKPSATTMRRIHAAVSEDEPAHRDDRSRWAFGLALGAAAGIAALLLLSLLGGGWTLAETRSQEPLQAPDVESDRARVEVANQRRVSAQPKSPAAVTEVHAVSAPPEPAVQTPSKKASKRPQVPPALPACEDDLASARILRAAERQLAEHPQQSLAQLQRHATRCPRSPFALEREALWIRAACRVGDVQGTDVRRRRFSKRADVGMYRDAIARDCDGSR